MLSTPTSRRTTYLLGSLLLLYSGSRILQLYTAWVPLLLVVVLHVIPPAAFALIHGIERYGPRGMLTFTVLCLGIASFFETLSLRTGFPFGHYAFTKVMGPKLFELPILLALAYLGIGYISWTEAQRMLRSRHKPSSIAGILLPPLLASVMMVAWDLAMDPVWATINRAWIWRDGGAWLVCRSAITSAGSLPCSPCISASPSTCSVNQHQQKYLQHGIDWRFSST
ncbi:carotenoid biosynthesis protein [Granulicella arctica]|uniref:carotenoid biosynthesis protein n=1 Tax=Granulicella arctica TaxID=940613 RepID=UPI0021DF4CA2|nr:carotenoid biosynthesis protein [Granulicella arctica]